MKKNSLSKLSRLLCYLSVIALTVSLFVPLWRIELDAPQYPEGLVLQMYPHKLGGQVDIINGLNHYIGMQTLHSENFIEFTILPYIIVFFALFVLSAAIINKRKYLTWVFVAFVIFGIVAMADFWRWEYNYGHHLDPNAAIIVPGMAYQPPLIGFKQLLNFGAYSIPDIGGWMFVLTGLLLLIAVLNETKLFNRFKQNKSISLVPLVVLFLFSCSNNNPVAIKYNTDKCDHCKMSISDPRFAAELITQKGRAYKFDDIICMIAYAKEHAATSVKDFWINEYQSGNELVHAEKAFFVKTETLKSPMGGNTAAFSALDKATAFADSLHQMPVNWETIK
jgi:copper chaperone NosL